MHLLLFCWDKTHLSQADEIFLHPWILTHPGVYELDGKRSSVQSSPTIAVAGDEFSFAYASNIKAHLVWLGFFQIPNVHHGASLEPESE